VIGQAKAKDVPVMAVAQPVDSPDAFVVSTDWDQGAIDGAKWLVDHMEGSKNVVVLEGFKGVPINESAMPKVEKILKDGGARIVARGANGFDEAAAQKAMAGILQSQSNIDGVFSFLAGGVGVPEAFKKAGREFVPIVGGSGYNGEACTLQKYKDDGLTGILTSGHQAIYAKALEQAVKHLDGEKIEQRQLFKPVEITSDDELDKYCLKDKPALFGITYEFPGLDLPLEDTLKYYKG
jgi:ribose transport system substrate-binding protein